MANIIQRILGTGINVDDSMRGIVSTYLSQREEHGTATDLPNLSAFRDAASPKVKVVSLSTLTSRIGKTVQQLTHSIGRGYFEHPAWDFMEVDETLMNESLFRRAVEKYVEQIWKRGYDFVGRNKKNVEYIRRRFDQMAVVSGQTTDELFWEMAMSLTGFANAVITKVRKNKASGGKIRQTFDGKQRFPVASYFVADPTTMMVDRDQYGNVRRWKQMVNPYTLGYGSTNPEWPAYNVIHAKDRTATNPKYFFGMPMVTPVIPDIKALRETEELAILQAIKHSIPRYHAKVGSDAKPGTQDEIDMFESYITSVSPDSMMITSNRIDVGSLSGGDNILDLGPYLEYWTKRIRGGLGLSGVSMGEGDTANRNTAISMLSEFQNTTIKFQQILKNTIEHHIIKELLYERGYNENTLSEENMVHLHIPEIDLQNKILQESHSLQLFLSNAISFPEMRNQIGRDNLSESEWEQMYLHMVQIPLAEAQADAKANAAAGTTGNQVTPANQHGRSVKPQQPKDQLTSGDFDTIWEDALQAIRPGQVMDVINRAPLTPDTKARLRVGLTTQFKKHQRPPLQDAVNGVFSVVRYYAAGVQPSPETEEQNHE